jgi:hypothetical protein
MDVTRTRAEIERLSAGLEGQPDWPELRSVYLDLSTLAGQLQGAVGDARREAGDTPAVQTAASALERLKAEVRQIGLDIRLASPQALLIGLQTALASAEETVAALAEVESQ